MNIIARQVFTLAALMLFASCTTNKTRITLNIVDNKYELESQDIFLLNQYGDSLQIDNIKSPDEYKIEALHLATGYYTLALKEKQINLYLTPSTDIHISLGTDNIKITGKGSEPNNFLKRKYSAEFDWYSNYYITKQTGDKIIYFRDSYINKLKQELEQITSNPQFVQAEQKELDYKYFNQLLIDKIMLETNPATDDAIMKDLEKAMSINIDDSNELNSSKNFVSVIARILVALNRVDSLSNYYQNIDHPNFKTYFLKSLVSALHKELQFGEDNFRKSKTIEAFINKQQPSDSIGHHIFNLYDKFHEAEGDLASFSYENVNGEIVSLESLRGKYVYIDFWATWCINCIKEFPSLKKLENQFEDKAIEFIGISVDKLEAKEKWKKMVNQKKLKNIQLLAPFQGHPDKDAIDDDFMKLLYINTYHLGIPHYALIDPNGKIVDAFFCRPSNPKTEKYLSELVLN
ncbi:TlpA disulfide reductase family protein [Winogradskyella sp.]|uniref:TlpA family protein disulfide reductase n=1 Tax=Winogradskyella sp. TaxID=1883156 RepID=UPI00263985B2|nr:TlpA disulfide reductase family protein [Winogradskyella sp.]